MRVESLPSVYAPGAALAEVHVALGIQRAVAHQLRHVLAAGDHLAAALDAGCCVTPRSSSPSAQKRPAGPVPMMIGRRSGSFTRRGGSGAGGTSHTSGGSFFGELAPGPAPPRACRCSGGCPSCGRPAPRAPRAPTPDPRGCTPSFSAARWPSSSSGSSSHSPMLLTRYAMCRSSPSEAGRGAYVRPLDTGMQAAEHGSQARGCELDVAPLA